ncbi:MAG: hypothetical protein KIT08_01515 [Anaerolineales bacterium]|nr:MAG: hypothetical protein KIT08_01515 [Anaerolineales bacterium]
MPENKANANKIREILTDYEKNIASDGKSKSLRFSAGLLGVSHTALDDWKAGRYVPKYEQLVACRERIATSYQTVTDLIAAITERNAADLVVGEADK